MSENLPSEPSGELFALFEALDAFKAGPLSDNPSNRALANAARVSPTTIGDWLRARRFPQDIGKVLTVVRMVRETAASRGVAAPAGLLDDLRWQAAFRAEAQRRAGVVSGEVKRAQAVSVLAGPAARAQVSDLDPRWLGVHAAISVPGVPDEVLPEYVPRDVDTAEFGVRARVAAAAQRGGFVLLVGGSSVGKTRCAAEAVRTLLPDWWLVHPGSAADVASLARAPLPRTVVWLDELQRYLDGERGLTGVVTRSLLNAPYPAVVIGTLWPDRYAAYTAVPAPGGADPHEREREVLDLATVIRISPEFSPAEQDRARTAASRDPRLRSALDTAGNYGLTQTLAAAPQLVARWQDAKTASPYAWAVLTAALDVARLGGRAPLSPGLLRAAAPGYCTSQQQAEAPDNWFEQALAYATEKLHGAIAALGPVGAGMGQVNGYTVADYLIQYASRERRSARVPASTWDALLVHIRDPDDASRLAHSAESRLLYRHAIPLYRHAATAGHEHDTGRLAVLLAKRGDLDELRTRAGVGGHGAAAALARLLAERGDLDGAKQIEQLLRARADNGDVTATGQLAALLAERGDPDELRTLADNGDKIAAATLAGLLAKRGDMDGAEQLLRTLADNGDKMYGAAVVGFAAKRYNMGGAEQLPRTQAGIDEIAFMRLLRLLTKYGHMDRGERADTQDDRYAAIGQAILLAERGDLDGAEQLLRTRADNGDTMAAESLAGLLAERGDLDGAKQIEQLLRTWADNGDGMAALALARLLAKRGDLDRAEQLLRTLADNGDSSAVDRLADLLAMRGDLDELRTLVNTRGSYAAESLADLLAGQLAELGRGEEAERVQRFGLNPDGSIAFPPRACSA